MTGNGISKLDLKRQNRMQILRLLRNSGPTSRIDIAREIGITKAAVTVITNEMIRQGCLYEKGEQAPRGSKLPRGRKKILLDISPTYKMDMGLVLEGDTLYFGVCTLHGEPVEKHAIPVPDGETADGVFALIEKIYRDLLYKNDLTPGQITGLGVCADGAFQEALGASLEKRLGEFVSLPMTFGSVAEGAALAECDYWQPAGEPAGELLAFRCGDGLSCALVLGAELRRGVHNRAAAMAESTGVEALLARCRVVFSQETAPELWVAAGGNPGRILPELRRTNAPPLDPPVREAVDGFLGNRLDAILDAVRLLDPGRVVLLEDGAPGSDALFDRLAAAAEERLGELGYPVTRSRIQGSDRFLAGAALATREFFLNRGGM